MQPFTTLTGVAAPLLADNIDTDSIVRVERLAAFDKDQLGPYAMEALRLRPDGSEDPACVLNHAPFKTAPIFVSRANFGCGSSREGAVWALVGSGVRCVIAESFGDIFYGNCFQNGMLPVRLSRAEVEELARQAADGSAVTVDLQRCLVIFPDGSEHPFVVDARKRASLLDGLDDVSRTLRQRDRIAAWQARDRAARPWVWDPVSGPR